MSEEFVTFRFPRRPGDPEPTLQELKLPWLKGKNLKGYYADTRFNHHLGLKNLRYSVQKMPSKQPVRSSFVPEAGDIFVFVSHGRAMS